MRMPLCAPLSAQCVRGLRDVSFVTPPLRQMADRIQARAVRRMGELLLKQFRPAPGTRSLLAVKPGWQKTQISPSVRLGGESSRFAQRHGGARRCCAAPAEPLIAP
jgi:hypothetical protein